MTMDYLVSPGITSSRNKYMSTRHVSHYLLYGERPKDRKAKGS